MFIAFLFYIDCFWKTLLLTSSGFKMFLFWLNIVMLFWLLTLAWFRKMGKTLTSKSLCQRLMRKLFLNLQYRIKNRIISFVIKSIQYPLADMCITVVVYVNWIHSIYNKAINSTNKLSITKIMTTWTLWHLLLQSVLMRTQT